MRPACLTTYARAAASRLAAGALLALVSSTGSAPLGAQTIDPRPAVPARVSLAEAIALAERWRPQYRRALNDEDVAHAGVRRQAAGYLPTLDATLTSRNGGSRVFTGTDDFGNPIRLDDPRTFSSSQSNQILGAELTVYDFGRREAGLGAARARRSAARAGIERERLLLRSEVTQRYYAALTEAAGIEVAERQLAAARDQLELTERKFRVAGADREAVLGARAGVASAEGRLVQARGAARRAQLVLLEAIGLPLDATVALADTIPDLSGLAVEVDALVARALDANPEIRAAEAELVAADRSVAVQRAGYLPRLTAGGSFVRSMSSPGNAGFLRVDPLDQAWGVNLGLTFPLFDGFVTREAVARASADRADAREGVRQQRLATERQVRSLVVDVEVGRERLLRAREAVALGRERLELAERAFQTGALTFDQYQRILDQLVTYERDELDARAGLAAAVAGLEQVVGEPIARGTGRAP